VNSGAEVLEYGAMSPEPASDHSNLPLFYPAWPGYRTTKNRLERLIRFKNLIVHREQWAPEMDSSPTLDELFPGEKLQEGSPQAVYRIDLEIRETMLLAFRALWECGVSSRARVTISSFDFNFLDPQKKKKETVEYDLLVDYFNVPSDVDRHRNFEAVMQRLDMGIGAYKDRLPRAKRDRFNPLMWTVFLVRLPITVLERAGMLRHPNSQEKLLNVYTWVVQFSMLALILAVLGHYGAKIPWSDIFSYVMKLMPK
jgi:hypothetical protein